MSASAEESWARQGQANPEEDFGEPEVIPMAREREQGLNEQIPEFGSEVPSFAEMGTSEAEIHSDQQQMNLEIPAGQGQQVRQEIFEDDEAGFQPAAYRPAPESHEMRDAAPEPDAAVSSGRRPGVPSAETIARLKAAVAKNPEWSSSETEDVPSKAQGGPRFRVNGLIDRMTKQREAAGPRGQTSGFPQSARPTEEQQTRNVEHDRVGIPAFLRRQAN